MGTYFRALRPENRARPRQLAWESPEVTERRPAQIQVEEIGDRILIEVPNGRWEGTASDAERLLTRLHYALDRVQPGTNIVSMFVNGQLWGGKIIEPDSEKALEGVRRILNRLSSHAETLADSDSEFESDS